jgi:DnaJ-class molecular chaperone
MNTVEVIKEKVECDYCDGCGWYEGGPYLKNRCNHCGGLGYIEQEREVAIQHKWKNGEFKRELGNRYLTKNDECELCGCIRQSIQTWRNKKQIEFVVTYSRGMAIYPSDHIPECWGAKNP